MKQYLNSVSIALLNIKANPLHTFLSILGIIIGVASLVAILSLADGLEQTGREQIETTTSIQMMSISPRITENVNGVNIPRDTIYNFDIEQVRNLGQSFQGRAVLDMQSQQAAKIEYGDSVTATYIQGTTENAVKLTEAEIIGEFLSTLDVNNKNNVVVLTSELLSNLGLTATESIGDSVKISGQFFKVKGVVKAENYGSRAVIPLTVFKNIFGDENQASITVKAVKVENLPALKKEAEEWLYQNFEEGREAFNIFTYENRVEQLSQGILIFKLVMGAITGISVLVGGIGIMNVLLISVTERTKEIGIRKATGARKKDIVMQFLSESVTISLVGCIIGWLIGLAAVFGMVELINRFTEMRFQAAASMGTVLVVLGLAVFIGVLFGTYPAWKAANLTPVDAIRHE